MIVGDLFGHDAVKFRIGFAKADFGGAVNGRDRRQLIYRVDDVVNPGIKVGGDDQVVAALLEFGDALSDVVVGRPVGRRGKVSPELFEESRVPYVFEYKIDQLSPQCVFDHVA